jgi:hypothetical protein
VIVLNKNGYKFFINQKKSIPFKNPMNSGGSPRGVAAPPIFAIINIKNTIKWVVCRRPKLARKKGRISRAAAPVVPIHPAIMLPKNKNNVLKI